MKKINPLVITKHGKKLAVLAFTDIDGTVNSQGVPEYDRLTTTTPAKEAILELQYHTIPVGIVTARSFGETLLYQETLGAGGFTITENGAVIILPQTIHEDIPTLAQKNHIVTHDKQTALILSKVELPTIKDFVLNVIEQLGEKGLPQNIVNSCTSTPQELKELIKYQTIDDATRATDRLASAFVRDVSDEQFTFFIEKAKLLPLQLSGTPHHAHIMGNDVDKGSAIQFIHDNISHFLPEIKGIEGILPIVFGNDYNDLQLFEKAHVLGGIGIMVKDSKGYYRVPNDEIPPYIIKTEGAYGYGMKEAIKTILKKLEIT